MKPLPPAIDATLTRYDLARPFEMADHDDEPLPSVTRCALLIDGTRYAEIDPRTWNCITVGDLK